MPLLPADTPRPPADRRGVGAWGETQARGYLERAGYRIIDAHVTAMGSELDLIAVQGDRVAFCEVRVRRTGTGPAAVASLGPRKRRALIAGAHAWMAAVVEMPPAWHFHFDLLCIEPAPGGRGWELTHLEDAFTPESPWEAGRRGDWG